jgi:hypothetical protein
VKNSAHHCTSLKLTRNVTTRVLTVVNPPILGLSLTSPATCRISVRSHSSSRSLGFNGNNRWPYRQPEHLLLGTPYFATGFA